MKTYSELKLPKGVFFSQQTVFYGPRKAESSRATHLSEGLSEPPALAASPGSPNSWPVACSGNQPVKPPITAATEEQSWFATVETAK